MWLLLTVDTTDLAIVSSLLGAISVLFAAMLKAKADQVKQMNESHFEIIKAKDEQIIFQQKLIDELKISIENLQVTQLELIGKVEPALKTTQDILKELINTFREIKKP